MTITAVSADGVQHQFPDGTDTSVISKVMKDYAVKQQKPSRIAKLGTQAQPKQSGILDRLKAAVFVPKDQRYQSPDIDPIANPFGAIKNAAEGVVEETAKDFKAGASAFASDISPAPPKNISEAIAAAGEAAGNMNPGTNKPLMDLASMALSPLTGAATALIGRPVEEATGLKREITGNAISALVPLGGEAKAGKVAKGVGDTAKILEGTEDAEYAAKVKRLKDEGVEPTAGQQRGGAIRRFEEGHKSDPLVGQAIRDTEAHALRTFNRAIYNRVLKPIGITLNKGVPIGRKTVKIVGDMVSKAYNQIKPDLNMDPDDILIGRLSEIRTQAAEHGEPHEKMLEAILNNRLLTPLGRTGKLTGEEFKTVESDLSSKARELKSSSDVKDRGIGDALDQVIDELRENLQRTSAPGVRAKLKAINESWSLLTRLEDAAARRLKSGGVVQPTDLLGAVRKSDNTVRHRGFARGDAIMQQLGEDALEVLGDHMPDSGTAERLNLTGSGLTTLAARQVTNPVANLALNALRHYEPRAPGSKNFLLRSIEASRRAPVLSLGNFTRPPDQSQGQ